MNRFLVGTVGVACALLASTAIAGWTQAYPVVVDQQAMAVYGSLWLDALIRRCVR
ncbi:MAG: hypothetical protein IPG50_30315 [Myxococcales bacterium]|nr:hypothetical protein [Myxococcales bacterium]